MDTKTFPAELGSLESMMGFIADEAHKKGFDERQIFHIKLAAEEILVNIINYAYRENKGTIEITLVPRNDGGVEVKITDWGIAFDPLSLPDPDIHAPMEKRKIGGLGVFLVRRLMDDVTYRREEDRNILTFVKLKNQRTA